MTRQPCDREIPDEDSLDVDVQFEWAILFRAQSKSRSDTRDNVRKKQKRRSDQLPDVFVLSASNLREASSVLQIESLSSYSS